MTRSGYKAILLTVLVLGLGGSEAQAQPALSVKQARTIFLHAEPHGRFHGCKRELLGRLDCLVDVREVVTHEWEDPATGEWVKEGRAAHYVPARVPVCAGGVVWSEARLAGT